MYISVLNIKTELIFDVLSKFVLIFSAVKIYLPDRIVLVERKREILDKLSPKHVRSIFVIQ